MSKWNLVSMDLKKEMLTTERGSGRHEDFFFSADRTEVMIMKHYGDHDYDSGTSYPVPNEVKTPHEALLKAVLYFHNEILEG